MTYHDFDARFLHYLHDLVDLGTASVVEDEKGLEIYARWVEKTSRSGCFAGVSVETMIVEIWGLLTDPSQKSC